MSYEVYRYIFYGGAILAGIMLAVSVLLFFMLKIPHVIGDLTGANARKAIENIRNQNEGSGDKVYKSSHVNRERGKLTEKISPSGRLVKNPTAQTGAMPTEKIGTPQPPQANETTVLGANETTVLGSNETTVLGGGAGETTVLDTGAGATTLLSNEPAVVPGGAGETTVLTAAVPPVAFQIEYEITYVHTDEVIV